MTNKIAMLVKLEWSEKNSLNSGNQPVHKPSIFSLEIVERAYGDLLTQLDFKLKFFLFLLRVLINFQKKKKTTECLCTGQAEASASSVVFQQPSEFVR